MRCAYINFITLCATQFSSSLSEMGYNKTTKVFEYIYRVRERECVCVCVCFVVHLSGDLLFQHTQNTNKLTSTQKQSVVH
jgi:hypothetical protein